MDNPSPLGVLLKKLQFQSKLFTSTFLQATVAGPILGIDFLRKLKVIVSPEISQIQFACSAAAPPANILPSAAPSTATTSSQPPAVSAYLVRNPEVKSPSFSFRENQSLLDSPPSYQKIPDSVPDDVKTLLQKFSGALTLAWISLFGVPKTITSDHGPQFTSNLWFQLCKMLNISHNQTTAYYPELNGAVERLHRRLKDAVRARATAATWSEELPFVLLGLRAQPREDTGLSPAEAVFSAQIVLPNEFLQNDELSVDTIVKNFSKTLHVSAPSLPRQNSSTDLPSELPAKLLSALLVWVHRGGLVPPL
jgi:hypothetical protein